MAGWAFEHLRRELANLKAEHARLQQEHAELLLCVRVQAADKTRDNDLESFAAAGHVGHRDVG